MDMTRIEADVALTPQQVAEAFWNLDAKEQADFFAALDAIAAPGTLCMQMAFVVGEIRDRADRGDHAAMLGFRTVLAHAEAYAESAIDLRCWQAKRELRNLAGATP